jgi:predicted metalloprotease with PDZ domain
LKDSGYRLVYAPTPTPEFSEHERRAGRVDLTSSLGLMLGAGNSGKIRSVVWGSAAFDAGLLPGSTILQVDGAAYSPDRMLSALGAHRTGSAPIRLLVSRGERTSRVEVDYHGGPRFPRLERVAGTPDRLTELLRPKTGTSR